MNLDLDHNYTLARVKERSVGSLFFSIFGGLWLFIGFFAFGLLTRAVELVLAGLMLAFIAAAAWLLQAVPRGVKLEPQRERDGRIFGWVNAAQGAAIFVVFQLASRLHHPNAAFPLAVLIVGLHIFALPRSYRILSNLVTGAILVIAAALCLLLLRGDVMVGTVTLCAGITLWCSAVWKLRTAMLLLQASNPAPLQQAGCTPTNPSQRAAKHGARPPSRELPRKRRVTPTGPLAPSSAAPSATSTTHPLHFVVDLLEAPLAHLHRPTSPSPAAPSSSAPACSC